MRRGFTLIELLIVIAIIAILAGVIFVASSYGIDRARLASALQTVSTSVPSMSDCYMRNVAIAAPDDVNTPAVSPCVGANVYGQLGSPSSPGCIYNTSLVNTTDAIPVVNGAIQAGCKCSGTTIATCSSVFQCDFATTGKCKGNDIAN